MKKIIAFITKGIWDKDISEYKTKPLRWAVRQLKVILVTVRGIGKHNIVVLSASLTFYTMMSLVPIAALVFAVVKGFGLQESLYHNLHASFPEYNDLINNLMVFADNMLARTKGGLIAGVGIVILFWAIMRVFGNVERVFNQIWEVRSKRGFARKFSDYLTVVIIAPLLWILTGSLSVMLRRNLACMVDRHWIETLFSAASLVVLWAMFTFIYVVLPNTKVRLRSAMTAAIVAGTALFIFQSIYFYVQTHMMAYNAIYGSFAALPLFLIWMQINWHIVLFGAELSYAYQNLAHYEKEEQALEMSYRDRQKVLLAVLIIIDKHFDSATGAITAEQIASELNLPIRIVRDVLFDLEGGKLVAAAKDARDDMIERYLPLRNVDALTVNDVINSVERLGGTSVIPADNLTLAKVGEVLEGLRSCDSPWNKPLSEVVK